MNLRKLILPVLSLSFVILSCKKDDDETFQPTPQRDRQEVYDENLLEIETYLATHFYNYEAFDFSDPYSQANDGFKVVFDTIAEPNQDKIPLIDQVTSKSVSQDGIDYKLYYLIVREGLGSPVNPLDRAAVIYNGTVPDGTLFDSAVTIGGGQPFNLTGVGNIGGVVTGFREGIIEFNTATSNTENPDGTITYNGHGIGAVFMPSGLGYFSFPPSNSIPQYSPLFFTLEVVSRSNTDWDLDGIPSHIENSEGLSIENPTDTDGDLLLNFIDNDDDGDGVLTRDEVEQKEYEDDGTNQFMTRAEAQSYFVNNAADDEIFVRIENELDGTYTLHTLITPKTLVNGVMVPNYLNPGVTTVL